MHSAILVHPRFDAIWPFSADHARRLWAEEGPVDFVRVAPDDNRAAGVLAAAPEKITRLLVLGQR